MVKVGVTGGIGCGKSFVCQIIERMGYPVYNADSRARWLATNCDELIAGIKKLFGNEAYVNGEYNRKHVGKMVFANSALLKNLNALVHPAVANDFLIWAEKNSDFGLAFFEAAILYESHFDKLLDRIIAVTAPDELRIYRVMQRDDATMEQVVSRINSQMPTDRLVQKSDYVIVNDERQLILPQVINVIDSIRGADAKKA